MHKNVYCVHVYIIITVMRPCVYKLCCWCRCVQMDCVCEHTCIHTCIPYYCGLTYTDQRSLYIYMHMHVCTHRQEEHIHMYTHGLYWDHSHRSEVSVDLGMDAVVHQVVPLAVDISLLHGHKQFKGIKPIKGVKRTREKCKINVNMYVHTVNIIAHIYSWVIF